MSRDRMCFFLSTQLSYQDTDLGIQIYIIGLVLMDVLVLSIQSDSPKTSSEFT